MKWRIFFIFKSQPEKIEKITQQIFQSKKDGTKTFDRLWEPKTMNNNTEKN